MGPKPGSRENMDKSVVSGRLIEKAAPNLEFHSCYTNHVCLEAAVMFPYPCTQPFWSFKDANNSVRHNGRLRQACTHTQRWQGKNITRPATSVVLQTKGHAKSPDWRQIPLLQSCPGLIIFSIHKSINQNIGFVVVDFWESQSCNGTRAHNVFSIPFSHSKFHSKVSHEPFFLCQNPLKLPWQ